MTTTPPPRGRLQTPSAPLHGAGYDTYSPYSGSPRRSKRLATQNDTDNSAQDSDTFGLDLHSDEKSDAALDGNPHTLDCDSDDSLSTPNSPKKSPSSNSDKQHNLLSPRAKNHASDITSGFPSLPSSNISSEGTNHSVTMTAGMLPTPAKTPRKKRVPNPGPVARTLFADSTQVMDSEQPSQKRSRGGKFNGFSLESFHSDPQQNSGSIDIYTDVRDRIPTLNPSVDNPFISRPGETNTPKNDEPGKAKRRKVSKDDDNERDSAVDDMVKRDDGVLYVFRGKKIFRKFSPEHIDEADDNEDLGLLGSMDGASGTYTRPLTRSSIRPRVLFPTAEQLRAREAKTKAKETARQTRRAETEEDAPPDAIRTPTAPSKATQLAIPSTPLASGRSLRSQTKKLEPEMTPDNSGNRSGNRSSPFDRWTRIKSKSSPAAKGKKRTSSSMDRNNQPQRKKIHQSE
ncbi:predicted protein [Uncinocarpus reesii 1704]|uniref:Uncharacterized protein n=1 Tax=Uncinocarpus reesii (strain UAMH 1704) TaxID=336963 RepID=C4JYV8_UNCRE|nr:uncharacterized protein UREG_07359 [Uncinocarpus reesii 1704]EEP82494.1 predicted protein [Uncinocarpus reesii 1704]